MSRIGIFSDVHANTPALRMVMRELRKREVGRFWFLGDLLGYGPYPNQVLQEMRAIAPEIWLMGNHDAYIGSPNHENPRQTTCLPGPIYAVSEGEKPRHVGGPRPSAWHVAQSHRELLSDDDLIEIGGLSPIACPYRLPNIVLAHAVYIQDGTLAEQVETSVKTPFEMTPYFARTSAPWFNTPPALPFLHISGHTHCEGLWERSLDPEQPWELPNSNGIDYDIPYSLDAGRFYAINPGSVGLPRGNSPCPTCAVLDTDTWKVTFHAFRDWRYDSEIVRKDMQSQDYPEDVWSERQLRVCQSPTP